MRIILLGGPREGFVTSLSFKSYLHTFLSAIKHPGHARQEKGIAKEESLARRDRFEEAVSAMNTRTNLKTGVCGCPAQYGGAHGDLGKDQNNLKNAANSASKSILVQPADFSMAFRFCKKTLHLYKHFQNRLDKTPG